MIDREELTSLQLDNALRGYSAVLLPAKTQPLERDEWSRRHAALEELTVLAHGQALAAPENQHVVSRWLRRAVIVQLADPRSAIVKAACAVIVAFAEGAASANEAKASGATICSWWVPSVFKCTTNTALVVVSAAQHVLDTLTRLDLWNYESTRALLEACESKHCRTRRHALTTLTHRLQRVQGTSELSSFAAFVVPLRRVVRTGLEDADVDVRNTARTTLVAFEAVFPEDAGRVRAGLHPSSRAALERSRASAEAALHLLSSRDLSSRGDGAMGAGQPVQSATSPSVGSTSVFDLPRAAHTLEDELLEVAAEKARQARNVSLSKAARRLSSAHSLSHRRHSGRSPTPAARPPVPLPGDASDARRLAEHLRSRDWATREAALRQLASALAPAHVSGSDKTVAASTAEKEALMALVVPLLDDTNVRVAASAQEVVRYLCMADPLLARPYLQHLCDVLLRFAASHRKASRNVAVLLLHTLVHGTEAGLVCTALAHTLAAEPAPAVRLRGVELVAYAISHKPSELAESGVMPVVLRCLAAELQQEGPHRTKSPVWSAVVGAVALLYETVADAFTKACAQLTGADLRLISEALRASHPELDESTEDTAVPPEPPAALGSPPLTAPALLSPPPPTAFGALVADATTAAAQGGLHATPSPPAAQLVPSSSPFARPRRRSVSAPSGRRAASPPHSFAGPLRTPASPVSGARDASARVQSLLYALCGSRERDVEGLRLEQRGSLDSEDDAWLGSSATPTLDQLVEAVQQSTAGIGAAAALCASLEALSRGLMCRPRPSPELADILVALLAPLCVEASQPQHAVRRRAMACVRTLVATCAASADADAGGSPKLARTWLPTKLTALLRLCRAGLDDAFVEVQQEAAILLSLVMGGCALPTDQCLNALSECLDRWLHGPHAHDATRGRLALLQEIGAVLERHQSRLRAPHTRAALAKASLSRVCAVLQDGTAHCSTDVRRLSILTLTAVWAALDELSYPFLLGLGPAERKLVTVVYNHALQQARQELPTTLGGFTLSAVASHSPPVVSWRNLNDELQAYEAREA